MEEGGDDGQGGYKKESAKWERQGGLEVEKGNMKNECRRLVQRLICDIEKEQKDCTEKRKGRGGRGERKKKHFNQHQTE